MKRNDKHIELSVIVPLYNEEESISLLYQTIQEALKDLNAEYEIIFVDDGSRDKTFQIACQLAERDERLRVIKFRRNYGQTPAMSAGIDNARGKILVTMDGDLQNDPTDIPNFIEEINKGFNIVVGWRHKRQDKLISRKIPSKIANWIIGKVTGVPIKDNGCSLKAYRAEVIQNIPLYSEMHRFIPAMTSIAGAKISEIKVKHHARKFGTSKYGLSRIYKVILDLLSIKTIISFASRPLQWFAYFAMVSGLAMILVFIYSVYILLNAHLGSIVVPIGATLLFGSLTVFLLFSGILCDLIYKTGNLKIENLSKITSIIE